MKEVGFLKKKQLFLILFLILLFHVLAWFALKPVWPFSDDYWYTYYAHQFLSGNCHLTYNQFQNRFGIYIPAGIFINLFGIDPYTIALWPLLLSCLTITFVCFLVRKATTIQVAVICAFLIATNTLQLTYAIALFPDLIVSFYCIAAVLILYYGRQVNDQKMIYPVLLNLFLLLGFLTKETILLIMPFLLLIFLNDLIRKRHYQFWIRTFLCGICAALLILLIYFLKTGDPFFRVRSLWSFDHSGFFTKADEALVKVRYSSNILKWLNSELGYLFILIMAAFAILKLRLKSIHEFPVYISVYTLVLLAEYILLFHTGKYGVLFRVDRLWMLTIAPLCILSAVEIYKGKNSFYFYLMGLLLPLCIYNYYAVSLTRSLLSGLFLIAAAAAYYLKKRDANWKLLMLLPFFILSIYFLFCNSNYRIGSLQSGNLIKNKIELLNSSGKKTILCAEDFADDHIIYNGFNEYPNLSFYPFSKYDSLTRIANSVNRGSDLLVIVNIEKTKVPDFISNNLSNWQEFYAKDHLLIYQAKGLKNILPN